MILIIENYSHGIVLMWYITFFFIWKDFDLDGLSKNRMGFSLSVIITIPFGV